MSPYCSQRFKQLRVQIYIYLHVINIEAEPELVWATIPGQFPSFCFHPVGWPPGLRMREWFVGVSFLCVCLRVLGFEVGGRLLTVTISSGPLMPLPKRLNGKLSSLRLVGPQLCLS